jgi:drug/metabolite transporter (DMT)-like permease
MNRCKATIVSARPEADCDATAANGHVASSLAKARTFRSTGRVEAVFDAHEKKVATRAYVALAIGIFATAWSAIFVRWAPIPGPASAFYRVFLAALVFWPYLFLARRESLNISRRSLCFAALGGFFFSGDLAAYNTAVLHTSAANAVLLGNNAPIFVGLFAWLLWKKAPRLIFWIGLAIAMSGSLLILGMDMLRHPTSATASSFGTGDGLALIASVFFSGFLMVTERVRNTVDATALLGISLLSSSLCLWVFDAAFGISLHVPSLRIWAALVGMGVFSQVLGYFSLTYALGHLPATITSVSLLVQAPIAAVLAYFLLGERYGWPQAVGAVLVLIGVGLVNLRARA